MFRLSINKILLSLSGLQLLIIGGIGYGLYRAGRMVEREYQGIRADANAILSDAPELVQQIRNIQPMLNDLQTIQPQVVEVANDVDRALILLQEIERRVPPS